MDQKNKVTGLTNPKQTSLHSDNVSHVVILVRISGQTYRMVQNEKVPPDIRRINDLQMLNKLNMLGWELIDTDFEINPD